jgi:hypothetical protein
MIIMKKRSKILTLGLGNLVDELIGELGLNKTQIHKRINEELESRGKKPITWNTVSVYLDGWMEERESNVQKIMNLSQDQVHKDAKWGIQVAETIAEKYDVSVAKSVISATSLETGMINALQFYSAVVTAGLAKILDDPSGVSIQDAIKAADAIDRIKGKGGAKTILSQAIQINTHSRDVDVEMLDDEILLQ